MDEFKPFRPAVPVHGGTFHESSSTVEYIERHPDRNDDDSSALWPTLSGNATDGYLLAMEYGHVVVRKNATGNAVVELAITDIPGQPDPILNGLAVADGDKIYCKVTEDAYGVANAAIIEKAAAWPTSTAPVLIGGDETTGANGTRHYRLCEIIEVDGLLTVDVLHTGHIDHFQPILVDNTTNTAYSAETGARVLKVFDMASGKWMLREPIAGDGIKITENTDTILFETDDAYLTDLFPHQWKATLASTTSLDVTGGVFRSQPDFDQVDVAGVAGLAVAASGYVILTVIRDDASREVADPPIISYVAGEPVSSDYAEQIIPLAKITFGGGEITGILPLKFEELHVFEDLAVVNGEFRLADLLLASRQIYELPP
jgi:hypothetical protein